MLGASLTGDHVLRINSSANSSLNLSSSLGLKLKSLGAQADDLDILLRAVKRQVLVEANSHLIQEPGDVRQLTLLLSGATCSYKSKSDGGRIILSFQHAGDFCDLHRYVLPDLEHEVAVQALTDCTIASIDYRDMDGLLSRPTLAFALWRASILEAAAYRERLSSTGRGTALERVAHLLCEQLARREAVGIHAPRLPFSQIDIADAVGLSAVHVNRTIQTLRSLKVLAKGNHIEVIDRERLERLAEFDGLYLTPSESCHSPVVSAAVALANPRSLSAKAPALKRKVH